MTLFLHIRIRRHEISMKLDLPCVHFTASQFTYRLGLKSFLFGIFRHRFVCKRYKFENIKICLLSTIVNIKVARRARLLERQTRRKHRTVRNLKSFRSAVRRGPVSYMFLCWETTYTHVFPYNIFYLLWRGNIRKVSSICARILHKLFLLHNCSKRDAFTKEIWKICPRTIIRISL